MDILASLIKLIFGSKADKDRKEIEPYVQKIKAIYPSITTLTNDELRGRSAALMQRIADFIAADEQHVAELKVILEKPETELAEKEKLSKEIDRTVLSSVTLKEPVTEHRLQGTKPRPTWHPTGTFRWPTSGRITSYFGGRKSPGGIGSTNHKGIDIAAPYGTPIYATESGTITQAETGWNGGYGTCVRIKHDNGEGAMYAHMSSLAEISYGDYVVKGQLIGYVGSTGDSTGNHLHFEVIENGVFRNPLDFVK